ncbi:amidase family protein [Corynebacterium ulceribovis]|uniref:amidase family protein n=1 Tax=Corynebacterium ulceribovis TaxID=487732 RepID=UPI000477577D|nr:amidase [Corynebacterium ulceribovis]
MTSSAPSPHSSVRQLVSAVHAGADLPWLDTAGLPGLQVATPELAAQQQEALRARRAVTPPADAAADLPLAGLPMLVKDLFPIEGVPCSYGSVHLEHLPAATSPVVQSLIDRGAIVFGTTATSEMGMTAYTEPVGMPAPDNPIRPGHTPGGSSGGAAVAVASGAVAAALASDGGGSIRVPAAACGVVGFKPAHDTSGGRFATDGFITRTVDDAAAMHGFRLPECSAFDMRGVPVGLMTEGLHADVAVQSQWRTAAVRCADVLSNAGAEIVEVTAPYGPDVFDVFRDLMARRAATLPDAQYSAVTTWLRESAQAVPPERAAEALAVLGALPQRVQRAWPMAMVITPTLAFDPPPIGHFSSMAPPDDFNAQTQWTPWNTLWNLTGFASVAVPVRAEHVGAAGAPPVSVQLGAISASQPQLLAAAQFVEAHLS